MSKFFSSQSIWKKEGIERGIGSHTLYVLLYMETGGCPLKPTHLLNFNKINDIGVSRLIFHLLLSTQHKLKQQLTGVRPTYPQKSKKVVGTAGHTKIEYKQHREGKGHEVLCKIVDEAVTE